MPDHIKFILRHAFVGFILALVFVAALLYLNVANLWHLVTHTAEGPIAVQASSPAPWGRAQTCHREADGSSFMDSLISLDPMAQTVDSSPASVTV